MSGQGHASIQNDLGSFRVEVRTVNHRGLKCNLRTSDTLQTLDSRIESHVRSLIHRGSVMLNVSWLRSQPASPEINQDLLAAYTRSLVQLQSENQLGDSGGVQLTIDLASLLELPGVIRHASNHCESDQNAAIPEVWKSVTDVMSVAFARLHQMRSIEGANMAVSLRQDAESVRQRVREIQSLAPRVVQHYAQRLETKIQRILSQREIESQPMDLLKEVQIYADRADISEEIMRLDSHLALFESVLSGSTDEDAPKKQSSSPPQRREPSGRKLDFIIQEMFRETNTIGSKSADSEISTHVVEIKCAIERMRELVQNLE